MLIDKNTFVRVRKHILTPEQRAKNIPQDTKLVPLKMWIKGRLQEETELFEEAEIKTATGRLIKGIVKEVEPKHKHSFGEYVDELQRVREIVLSEMWGGEDNEL